MYQIPPDPGVWVLPPQYETSALLARETVRREPEARGHQWDQESNMYKIPLRAEVLVLPPQYEASALLPRNTVCRQPEARYPRRASLHN